MTTYGISTKTVHCTDGKIVEYMAYEFPIDDTELTQSLLNDGWNVAALVCDAIVLIKNVSMIK